MTVRRTLPYLLALTLGASAALLAACGGGGTKDGIPAASAGELKSQIEDVKQAVDDGRCSDVRGQLRQVDSGIDDLPGSVEPTLVSALRDGAEKLRSSAVDECDPDAGTQTTETTTTETPRTETTTAPETTTEPTFTETTPTETTPTEPPATARHDDARAAARHPRAAARQSAAADLARRRSDSRTSRPMNNDVIANRYELGERLGYGGMSTVQVATDRRLERQVAVKLLAEHLADDSQFISRFRREALSAARLVHPNIVQVFDFGLDEASGRYYIVMEYIHGRSGAEIIREETRLGVADTLELVDGACRGLVHAHRMGVIHRDVKPGNILRSDDGAVKLADFGIAKAVGQTSQITQAGSVLGTAAYLAPEQASGAEVGPQADLYGLGVVTYQLLAGRLPYEAGSLTELALLQQREYPIRLDEIAPEVPAALALAVEQALALEPGQRYENAEAMRRALHDGARGIAVRGGVHAETPMRPRRRRCSPARSGPRRRRASTPPPPRVAKRLQPTPPPGGLPPATYEPIPDIPPSRRDREPARKSGGMGKLVGGLLLAAVLVVAIAFAVGSSQGGSSVKLSPVDGNSTGEVADQMNRLIDDNTR